MKIQLKRVYDPASDGDGTRILIDRLWPRGLKREAVAIDLWLKEVAPSDSLRRWFSHDVEKWVEFQKRYTKELQRNPALQLLVDAVQKGPVTLLYSAKDIEHNNGICLKKYLENAL